MARIAADRVGGIAVLAFLDLIAWSEIGPELLKASDDGYNVIVGSTASKPRLIDSYDDHPQVFVDLTPKLRSSAAGRYQFLARTWDALARDMLFHDFSPENQDLGAVQLIRECGALDSVIKRNTRKAIERCAPIWASFPGAGYGQHEHTLARLLIVANTNYSRYQRADFSNVIAGSESTA